MNRAYAGNITCSSLSVSHPSMRQRVEMDESGQVKHLYNGKELQENLGLDWYDYGARFYDPQLARFQTVDPMNQFASGYVYCNNNPIIMIDPSGMFSYYLNGQYIKEVDTGGDDNDNGEENNGDEDPPEQSLHYNKKFNVLAIRNTADPGTGWERKSFEESRSLLNEKGVKFDWSNKYYQNPTNFVDVKMAKTMMQRLIACTGLTGLVFPVMDAKYGQPVAIMVNGAFSQSAGFGADFSPLGLITVMEGKGKGMSGWLDFDGGTSAGWDNGLTIGITQFYYTGNPKNFYHQYVEGKRWSISGSGSSGFLQVGLTYSMSLDVPGGQLIAITKFAGFALPISGKYPSGHGNIGATIVKWNY